MEAATPLNPTRVRLAGPLLLIDGLAVDDETAVRLAGERAEAGEDLSAVVLQAIEIGARVLDREQTAANTDFVKAEFERTARTVETAFTEQARQTADRLELVVQQAFGADEGQLTKLMGRYFADESSAAVQHRVRALVDDLLKTHREQLRTQFTSADASNPLAQFQQSAVGAIKTASDQQHAHLREMHATIVGLKTEVAALKAEQEKDEAVAEEAEKGTGKGRTYEEQVADALAQIAHGRGDCADAVGDRSDAGRAKKGDVVCDIGAQDGPAVGRIAFEAKDRRLSQPEAIRELSGVLEARNADFAVLVVPSDEEVPARLRPLTEYHGDKMVVVWNADEGSALTLEVAYALARARVLLSREGGEDEVDAAAIGQLAERALQELKDVRKVRSNLTAARTGIDAAGDVLDGIERAVRGHLDEISALVQAAAAA